ncbi:MAG: hypothetical protein ACLUVC_14745 [Longibaculum sp.]
MKNDQEYLEKRGCISQRKLFEFKQMTKEELLTQLDGDPITRTSCIYFFSAKFHNDSDFTNVLLNQLIRETAINARIEIQDNLATYGNVYEMCQFLGKVGHNQHREIPPRVSLKKSYPLPRDLVARSLGHAEGKVYPDFLKAMKTLNRDQLLEGIDAFGFFCFYNRDVVDQQAYQLIEDFVHQYENDELMTWKLTICLSAFPQSVPLLSEIKNKQKHPTIQAEVERSLMIIERLNNRSN